ncbi:ABC transporter ATP-binding protein [Mangrovicoccus algicola]|uniref:ABC transporter ATP-binding protein n=1 Tax=Mangrovicoccus algicola TaxID=2771008 RepID=A0A8J7CV44_9RHOB|nr:ABC transporter ATP-binding protein [Mangrovicoccus algicola]MBE3638309.1 ABC transporter ATP-binding protein [Mangrovicoccus algicola]
MAEILRLDGITKRFGPVLANDDISFALNEGEVLALLGENGAGKTTLMNILFGHYMADAGTVTVAGTPLPPGQPGAALEAGVGMVHQHFTLAGNLSVLDNVMLGTRPLFSLRAGRRAARARLAELSGRFGLAVDPDARVADLSVGERQRVEILKALYRDARVLILDEPTAVLTPQEVEALFATIRKAVAQGLAVVFISHKLGEVMAVADRVVILRRGAKVAEMRSAETDRHRLAEAMVGAEITPPDVPPAVPGEVLFRLDRVSTAGTPGLRAASLALRAGTITGIAGVSGNGQRALADLLSGLEVPVEGRAELMGAGLGIWSPRRAVGAGIARIPEDRHATGAIADFDLTGNAMLEDYHRPPMSRRGWLDRRAARRRAEEIIARYDVRCPGPATPIRLLSGGNMQKLILGRVLEAGPRIILAAQPTRGLDIGAVTYVHRQLLAARARGAAVLLISEDLDELRALSDVIHAIHDGELSPAFARGEITVKELGLWMAGQGGRDAA